MSELDHLFSPEESEEEFLKKIRKMKYQGQKREDTEKDVSAMVALESTKEILDRMADDCVAEAKRQLEADGEKKREKASKEEKDKTDIEKKGREIDNEMDCQDIDYDNWYSWESVD